MDLLKGLTAKVVGIVVGGAVVLGVIVGAVSWYQMPPDDRSAIIAGVGRIFAWVGVVLVLPWALSPAIAALARRAQTNLPGVLLLLGLTAAEALLLAWMLHWSISGGAAWTFFLLGLLLAAAYNLLTCDWLAERLA
jgi:hypothetical protein